MIRIRKSAQRGLTTTEWLTSNHTFSFANFYDPNSLGFQSIKVINEDIVRPHSGFPMHAHKDMEIISYVIEGALQHQDSLGNGSIIQKGEIQKMSAGAGIYHSEFNPSESIALHLLQIWIEPKTKGASPSYQQKNIPLENNQLILIGSPEPAHNSVVIDQNVHLFKAYLEQDHSVKYNPKKAHSLWLQLIKGCVNIQSNMVYAGDGIAITEENEIEIVATETSELLLFDLW